MKFAVLYPYAKPQRVTRSVQAALALAAAALYRYAYNRPKLLRSIQGITLFGALAYYIKTLSEKNEVDDLFTDLQKLDSDRKDASAASPEGLIERCEGMINRQLMTPSPTSRIIVAVLFAAKMELYSRTNRLEEIRHQYGDFIRAIEAAQEQGKKLTKRQASYFRRSLLDVPVAIQNELVLKLKPVLVLKDGVDLQQVSVPDILASASVVCGRSGNLNQIRKYYHDLWDIKALQQMLVVMAYATQGYSCNHKGEVRQDDKRNLRIIFSDKLIEGFADESLTKGMQLSNLVLISLGGKSSNGKDIVRGDAEIRGTIGHELSHLWYRLCYENGAEPFPSMPRPPAVQKNLWQRLLGFVIGLVYSPTIVQQDPDAAAKARFNDMLKEASEIVGVKRELPSDALERIPLKAFDVSHYSEAISEIVVRVAHTLGMMVEKNKCSEEEVFKILRMLGFVKSLEFFNEEQKQMLQATAALKEKSKLEFRAVSSAVEYPKYVVGTEVPEAHRAVMMRDEKRLKELMNAESFDPTQRDMFDQNVVELALMCDDPRTVLTLFASPKVFAVLEQNHNLLVKALSYLVVLARDEKSEFSKEAFMLFKQEQEKVGSNDSWRAFYEAAKLGVDKKLVDFLKTKSDEEIIAAIERREISARDRFGNSFVTYMFEADKFKLWDEKIKKQFLIGPENSFIPFEPLHAAIGDNSPEQFLAALNKLKEANKPLPERLQRYEKNDSPMNHVRFRLRSSYSDEWNVNGQKTAGWIAVFKKLVTDFNVDPVADAALLRRELRAEIVKDFPSELEMRIEVEGNKIEKSRLEKKQDEKKEKDGDKKSLAKPVAQKLQQKIQQQDKPLGV